MRRPANTQFAIAVHALTLLSTDPGSPQSSEEMAGSIGASPVHMRRVLGRLRTAGIVDSRPGPNGGWRLRRDPAAVQLGEIWRAVDGNGHILGLHEANPACPVGRKVQATLIGIDRQAADALVAALDRTTVADILLAAEQPQAASA
jgi:Rrf2 family protein